MDVHSKITELINKREEIEQASVSLSLIHISKSATGATVRVLIETSDGKDSWTTVGVSVDVIEASKQAIIDSIEYKLNKDWSVNVSGNDDFAKNYS